MEDPNKPGPARGRARAYNRPSQEVSPPGRPSEPTSTVPGLAEIRDILAAEGGGAGARGSGQSTAARGGIPSYAFRYDFVVTRPEGIDKRGKYGNRLPLVANYFPMKTREGWAAYHYRVDFEPHLDETSERREAFKRFQQEGTTKLGNCMFDGHSIWTINRFTVDMSEVLTLTSSDTKGNPVLLKVKMVKELSAGSPEFLQVYNNIIRKCLRAIQLVQIGRNYFDDKLAIQVPQRNLMLWPGFLTTLRGHDCKDLLYCVEITHKVIRKDSVFQFIEMRKGELRNVPVAEGKRIIASELVGTVVMTSYNKKTYRVDEVLWDNNPLTVFKQGDGSMVTVKDYTEKRYGITVTNNTQPLLQSNPKKADIRRGFLTPVKLIPEACCMTGLSDSMRSDFMLMRDLGQHLFQPPGKKVESITNFVNRLRANPEVQKELDIWEMHLDNNLVQVPGRLLPPEQINFSNSRTRAPDPFMANEKGDFTMAFRNKYMFSSVHLKKWVIIVPGRDVRNLETTIQKMKQVATPIGFQLADALKIVQLQDPRSKSYADAITEVVNEYKDLQLIFIVLQNNRADTYSTVKKKCYLDYGISSQCFLSKNLTNKGIMSIATKVVVQMNAKLGGQPWTLTIPLKKLMIVGFDVHHGGVGSKAASVGAMVCTTTESYGNYFSVVSYAAGREEMSTKMASDIQRCLVAYRKQNNGILPDRIIFYRDGVGEGQIQYVVDSEIEMLKEKLAEVYTKEGLDPPKFSFIICTKRINARFFLRDGPTSYRNPPPGTIVDDVVTLPERWDFFLISPDARQGTVTPTNYNVIYEQNKLDPDKLQRLTFKLCHMYYNWSGTVAVPAVCQYAHKLAYLTGLSLGTEKEPNGRLTHLLYFL